MTEKSVYNRYQKLIFKANGWDIRRIENTAGVGDPDVQAVSPNGVTFYIENKIGKPSGDRVSVTYQPGQVPRIKRLQRQHAPVCIAVWWNDKVWYLPPQESWAVSKIDVYHNEIVKKYFPFLEETNVR